MAEEELERTIADLLTTEEEDDEHTYHHRISIPGAELEDVIEACMDVDLEYAELHKSITIYEGSPVRTIVVEYDSHEETAKDMAYRLGRTFKDTPVFLVDGSIWENTHTILRS